MLFRFSVSLAAVAFAAACSSTPQTAGAGAPFSYKAPSLSNISRIDIAQRYRFEERTLPEFDGGVISASAAPVTDAHDKAAALPDRYSSRIQNLGAEENAKVIYHRAASDIPDGWRDDGDAVVHEQSGLSCPLQINVESEGRQFLLERITQFDTAGRDVGCGLVSTSRDVSIVVFASFWPDVTLEEHSSAAATSIFQRYTVSEQLPVPVVTLGPSEGEEAHPELYSGMEETLAGGFAVGDVDGVSYKTSFWLAKTHNWHVKLHATYPQDDVTSEIIAAVYFSASHLAIRAKNLSEPTAPGVDV